MRDSCRSAVAKPEPESGLRQEPYCGLGQHQWARSGVRPLAQEPGRPLASGTSPGWQWSLQPLHCLAQMLARPGLKVDPATELGKQRRWEAGKGREGAGFRGQG